MTPMPVPSKPSVRVIAGGNLILVSHISRNSLCQGGRGGITCASPPTSGSTHQACRRTGSPPGTDLTTKRDAWQSETPAADRGQQGSLGSLGQRQRISREIIGDGDG